MTKRWTPEVWNYWRMQCAGLVERKFQLGFSADKFGDGTLVHYAQRGDKYLPNDPPWPDYPTQGDHA